MAKREEAYGVMELAKASGVTAPYLCQMRQRGVGNVPAPDWQLACGPVWLRSTVKGWIEERRAR